MKIGYRSIGGFAGPAVPLVRQLDLDVLPATQAASLRAQIAAIDFFALPEKMLKAVPKSWDFLQELTVIDAGGATVRSHHIQFHQDALGDAAIAMAALIENILQWSEPPASSI